jgi:histone-lysine N-methyltransferase SETMAR
MRHFQEVECLLGTSNSWRDVSTLRMRAMIADPTENNICRVQQLLEGDRRLTVAEIADEAGISYGSTFAIITDELGYRKVCARWVPRLLTSEQKLNRLQVSASLG